MGKKTEDEIGYLVKEGIHSEHIIPVSNYVAVPRQLDLFDEAIAKSRREKTQYEFGDVPPEGVLGRYFADKITLSDFYERLSEAFYGGTRFNKRYAKTNSKISLKAGEPSLNGWSSHEEIIKEIKPDLIDQYNHWVGEVKAFRVGDDYKLRDDQMARYGYLQHTLSAGTKIDFVIYRHTLRDFCPTDKNPSDKYTDIEVLEALTDNTLFSVIVPYNVMRQLHNSRSRLVRRDNGLNRLGFHTRDPGTCLRSPSANMILRDPEGFLKENGLDPADYEIKRFLSPDNFYFGKKKVKPFPITSINYKGYEEWAEKFRRDPPKDVIEFMTNLGDSRNRDREASLEEVLANSEAFELVGEVDNSLQSIDAEDEPF